MQLKCITEIYQHIANLAMLSNMYISMLLYYMQSIIFVLYSILILLYTHELGKAYVSDNLFANAKHYLIVSTP